MPDLPDLGPADGIRILHVSDSHNRRAAFRLEADLPADLVVNTGDLCGIGGPIERFILRRLVRIRKPTVLAPGNHDSRTTMGEMARLGAVVLDRPRLAESGGVRIWGYPDPNRSRMLLGPRYQSDLCRAEARRTAPELLRIAEPFVIAVHHEAMVDEFPEVCPLVLTGHFHSPRVQRRRHALLVRTGSTGGRNGRRGAMHFSVIDIDPQTYAPRAVRQFVIAGDSVESRSPAWD